MNPLEGSFPFTRTLPAIGTREGATLDFKAAIKLKATAKPALEKPFEVAKDVAAFANTYGGTLLVGAVAIGEQLSSFLPLTDEAAHALERLVEEAVRDRCRPGPSVAFERLTVGAGVVLAIHVAPFPSVVAVRVRADRAAEGYGDDAWVFYSRVTSQCKAFSPEVLPMLMIPEVRRTVILLRSIDAAAPVNVHFTNGISSGSALVQVDELANVVIFSKPTQPDFEVALDEISSVYRKKDGNWVVKCK